jgi:sister-chromatid-cohesion protein PDS5
VCLKLLGSPDAPYYQQYTYLLDSLSTVKSVVLITDIPESDNITLQLFQNFFDIAKPEGSKTVEYHMTDILIQLIDECNSLPTDVIDIIMAQFLRMAPHPSTLFGKKPGQDHKIDPKQTKLTSAVPPPAYNMAKQICNSCVDKMARHVCQYFSDVILEAVPSSRNRRHLESGSPDGDADDHEIGAHEPSREEMKELEKAHTLAKELWKACPQVLQNVIPQLEQELLADNVDLRKLACETVGDMALTGNFSSLAPATWKVWVSRSNDKSAAVRALWSKAAVRILKQRSDFMATQLVDLIAIKLNDLDDTVRFAVCESLRALDYQTITSKLADDESPFNTYDSSKSGLAITTPRKGKVDVETTGWGKRILQILSERVRDKKVHVRLEGMRCLARMWDMAYKDIAAGNEVVFKQLGWIPSKILDTFYINDPEVNVMLDHVLHEILIPVNYPPIEKERYGGANEKQANGNSKGKSKEKESASANDKEREKEILEGDKIRVQRLLVLIKGLDTKAKRALFAVPLRQISYGKVMEVFLKACEEYNVSFLIECLTWNNLHTCGFRGLIRAAGRCF